MRLNTDYVNLITANKKKIFVRPIWKLMHKINYLKKYPRMNLKNSLIAEKSVISLPSSSNLIKYGVIQATQWGKRDLEDVFF